MGKSIGFRDDEFIHGRMGNFGLKSGSLLVIATHPIQYLAPIYRLVETKFGIRMRMLYGSDFSVSGYFDKEFQTPLAWDVDLFASPERCAFLSRASAGGAKSLDEVNAKGMGRAIRQFRADAVLLTGYSPLFHLHAFYHAYRLGVPILFRAETAQFAHTNGWHRTVRNVLLRALYSKCTRLLPIGKRSYAHYRDLGCPESKLVLSPYCVDTTPFQCEEDSREALRAVGRAELGIPEDRIVLLFSGKIIAHKRPLMLLEAVKSLPFDVRSRITIAFLGNGPDLPAVREAAACSPAIPIVCTGFKGQTQLSRYYHSADALVLPSKSETWGLVVNEALHHGLPCVVTDNVSSALDLVLPGVTGEIASGSVEDLSRAIERVLRLIGQKAVREQCRAHMGHYTVEEAAKGIFRAFGEATHPATGHSASFATES